MPASTALLLVSLLGAQAHPDLSQYYADHGYYGFGETVGRAGDVNRDGVPDFVVGDCGIPGEVSPRFWIVSGQDSARLATFEVSPAGPLCSLIDGGVDANGDGVPDLLLLSYGLGASSRPLLLLSGKSASALQSFPVVVSAVSIAQDARFDRGPTREGRAGVVVLGSSPDGQTGVLRTFSAASADCISQRTIRTVAPSSWRAFTLRGGSSSSGSQELLLLTSESLELHALDDRTRGEGSSAVWKLECLPFIGPVELIALGDLDGDSVDDLAFSSNDSVEIVSGAKGLRLRRIESRTHRDSELGFGRALACLGDIDGDGVDDLAVSESEAGAFQGSVHAFSGKTGRELWETRTLDDPTLYHLGSQMAAIGDVDHDGITDLIVGTSTVLAKEPGLACLISGRNGAELRRFRRRSTTDLEVMSRAGQAGAPR